MWFGGLLNYVDPVIGFQLYIWIWVGLVVLSLISYAFWYFIGWKPYTPLHGLYYAYKAGSNAAFIFDKSLVGEMVDERTAKCIFDYSKDEYEIEHPGLLRVIYSKIFYYPMAYLDDISVVQGIIYKFGGVNKDVEIARHLQNGEWERYPSVICGGVPVDIIVDGDNWTIRSSYQHKAIEKCAREWNEINPDDQIHSYVKFQKYLMNGNVICDSIKYTSDVTWTRIDAGFPLDLEESDWAGKRRAMAEEQFDGDAISKNQMAKWILVIGPLVAAAIMGIRLITYFV